LALPRLGDVAVDAARVDRAHDRVDVGVAREHDAVGVGADLHRASEELDAAHRRHSLVGDDDGRVVRLEELEAAGPAVGGQQRELVAVVEGEGAEDVRLVVDHDHGKAPVIELHAFPYPLPLAALSSETADASAGNTMRNVAPAPGALSTSIRPPWALVMPCAIASPSPVPAPTSLVVKNGSKTRPSTSAAMPWPSSRMVTITVSRSCRVSTQTLPIPSIASQALASTFMKTWFTWPGSHSTSGSVRKLRWIVTRSRHRGSRSRSVTSSPSCRSASLRVASSSREKLRRSLTIATVRSAPRAMMSAMSSASRSIDATSGGAPAAACASRRRSGATLAAMKLTGLLSSSATPATSRPSDAIFSKWTSFVSAFLSSV